MSDVEFNSHADEIKRRVQENIEKALYAMGETCIEMTIDYMDVNYDTPIYDTGNLQRDVNMSVNLNDQTVSIGNSLEYAPWVHGGTRIMKSRPYLKDAIEQNIDVLEEVAAENLKDSFKE